jgi:nucleoid-associated protein YejK
MENIFVMNEINQDECIIQRVIVHVLDNTQPEPLLTDFEVNLPQKYEILLRSHISTSLQSSVPCRFDNRTTNQVCILCEDTIDDPAAKFVSTSRELTKSLFSLMKKQSINAGTLWVVMFSRRSQEQQDEPVYIALLKMDDKSSLTWRQESNEEGKRILYLEGNDHTVPQAEVRLDKAAFIFPRNNSEHGKLMFDYDLRLLDRKLTHGNIADYFTAFLGCSAAFEAKRNTQRFINTVDGFTTKLQKESDTKVEELRAENKEEEASMVESKFTNIVQNLQITKKLFLSNHDEIDNHDYAKAALGDDEIAIEEQLLKALRKSITADVFRVDEETKRKFRQRTMWKLKYGNYKVDIRGKEEDFLAMVDDSRLEEGVISIRVNDIIVSA